MRILLTGGAGFIGFDEFVRNRSEETPPLTAKPDDEAFAAFNKLEADIDDMEVRAEVAGQLDTGRDSVDVQLQQITFNDDVEDEFKQLQAECGGLLEDKSAKKTVGPDA